jgi:hypothetical protein
MDQETKINRTVRLPPSQIKQVEKESDDLGIDFSEFVRQALDEKLKRGKVENKEFNIIVDQIKKMHPEVMHSDLQHANLTAIKIFEEVKRQNEILKIILRRVSLGAKFSAQTSDKINGDEVTNNLQMEVVELVNSEIKTLQI